MPLLILLAFPVAEAYLFFKLGSIYGYTDLFTMYLLGGVFGYIIMKTSGSAVATEFQLAIAERKTPSDKVIHRALIFFGGFLLFIPGLISDVIGMLFILPGIRHIVVVYLKYMFFKKLAQGAIKAFSFGSGFGGSFGATFGGGVFKAGAEQFRQYNQRQNNFSDQENIVVERDVEIIDVTPIVIEDKKNDDKT